MDQNRNAEADLQLGLQFAFVSVPRIQLHHRLFGQLDPTAPGLASRVVGGDRAVGARSGGGEGKDRR